MRKNCKTFEAWIESMYHELLAKAAPFDSCLMYDIRRSNNQKSCYAIVYNIKTGKTASVSIKIPQNETATISTTPKALALAWAKYNGIEIPNFSMRLSSLKIGEAFRYAQYPYYTMHYYLGPNPITNDYIVMRSDNFTLYHQKEDVEVIRVE